MKSCSLDVEDVEVDKPEDLQADLINFDTTALIALVLGISNCGTEKLFATPEIELRQRFKSNYEFVIAQVMSEIQNQCIQNCIVLFLVRDPSYVLVFCQNSRNWCQCVVGQMRS